MASKAWEAADRVKVLRTIATELELGKLELESLRAQLQILRLTAELQPESD